MADILTTWLEEKATSDFIIKVRKLPAPVNEFYLWIVKTRSDYSFLFSGFGYFNLIISFKDNVLLFQLKIDEILITANCLYLFDDNDFLRRAETVEFTYSRYKGDKEQVINVYEWLNEHYVDLSDLYNKESTNYRYRQRNKKKVAELRSFLPQLASVIGLDSLVTRVTSEVHLPKLWELRDFDTSFIVLFEFSKLSDKDKSYITHNWETKKKQIKHALDPFLDLGSYMLNITEIQMEFTVNYLYNDSSLEVEIFVALIDYESYATTIGYYKSIFRNACKFTGKDLYKLADMFSLQTEELDKDELCRILADLVDNLIYKDFQK